MKFRFIGETSKYGLNYGDVVNIYFEDEEYSDDSCRFYYLLESDQCVDIDLFVEIDEE